MSTPSEVSAKMLSDLPHLEEHLRRSYSELPSEQYVRVLMSLINRLLKHPEERVSPHVNTNVPTAEGDCALSFFLDESMRNRFYHTKDRLREGGSLSSPRQSPHLSPSASRCPSPECIKAEFGNEEGVKDI